MCNALRVPVDLVDCITPRLNHRGAVGVCFPLCLPCLCSVLRARSRLPDVVAMAVVVGSCGINRRDVGAGSHGAVESCPDNPGT